MKRKFLHIALLNIVVEGIFYYFSYLGNIMAGFSFVLFPIGFVLSCLYIMYRRYSLKSSLLLYSLFILVPWMYASLQFFVFPEILTEYNWKIVLTNNILMSALCLASLLYALARIPKFVTAGLRINKTAYFVGVAVMILSIFVLLQPINAYKDLREGLHNYTGGCSIGGGIKKYRFAFRYVYIDTTPPIQIRIPLRLSYEMDWTNDTNYRELRCGGLVNLHYLHYTKIGFTPRE
ncbi:hypothetical protein IT418_03545 [bacterium]|nr:hypothetical protein [bacterium]